MQMDAILSIKPIYAKQILAGTKKVEFRKRSFKEKVRRVYIYASVPVKQIVGYFTFTEIDEDTPANLWVKMLAVLRKKISSVITQIMKEVVLL